MGERAREQVTTVANVVTTVRSIISMVLAVLALAQGSLALLVAAYAVYWVGDILDGIAARFLDQETVIGAVYDVIADRANTTLAAAAFIALRPDIGAPMAVFLIQFCLLDTLLTLSFLYFPGIISPNYFARVDKPIYLLNWSPIAKASNTGVVVLLCLIGQPWPALAWALLMTALKSWSLARLHAILSGRTAAAPASSAKAPPTKAPPTKAPPAPVPPTKA